MTLTIDGQALLDERRHRLVVVDATEEAVAGFYRRCGFVEVAEHPLRLSRKVADIRRSLDATPDPS
jgi:hypothetical protein